MVLYSNSFTEKKAALQVGRLQIRSTRRAAQPMIYDRLAPSHPSTHLGEQSANPVAAQMMLVLSQGWYPFIDPGGTKGLAGLVNIYVIYLYI